MTSLQTEPCEPECTEVTEFLFTFNIESFRMQKAEKFHDFEKQLTFTWDGNVIKSIAKEINELIGKIQLIVYASPREMFNKMRYSPIMLNFMAVCEDFGTIKIPFSQCFCEAVLCSDFKTQAVQNEFKFHKNGIETACIEITFHIEKVSRDSIAGILKSLDGANKQFQKNLRKKMRARQGDDESDDDLDPCPDFACLSELPEHCRKSLELGEHVYRIVNGHLINIRDKKGICGETCEVARKYCGEYRKVKREEEENPPKVPSPIDLQKLFSSRKPPIKMDCQNFLDDDMKRLSDNSLNCEKLLRSKDMAKYFEQQMEKVRKNFDDFSCGDGPKMGKRKCKKKKKSKKVLESEFEARPRTCPPLPIEPRDPQKTFIKKMKKKSRGKYSYIFGNTYPRPRSTCELSSPLQCNVIVPKTMGWRHDKLILSNNKKWYPGQINKTVRVLMKCHLRPYPYDTLMLSSAAARNRIESHELYDEYDDEQQKETLHIRKRNGEISLTMRPLKERKHLETDCNPYLNCSPLKFILKRHPEEIKKHQARMIMKARGCMRKCSCKDIKSCRCMSCVQKKLLQIEMKRLSVELKMREEMQFEDVYETSDSEIDFVFTPPSVTNAKHKCKSDVAHTGTQYEIKHFTMTKIKKKTPDGDEDKKAGKSSTKIPRKIAPAREKLAKKTNEK